jgi:ribosomal protein S18 acetylase RimI-like enzyme
VTPGDLKQLGHLLEGVLPPGQDADAAARDEVRAAAAEPAREVALLVAEGAPRGALGWWRGNPEPGVALLGFLVVPSGERRRGWGSLALELLLARLRAAGTHSVRTAVPATDYGAHGFLRSRGFTEMSIRDHVAMGPAGLNLLLFAREVR